MPLEVTAAVPSLTPLVTLGDWGSFGIVFLLQVMFASSSRASISLPVIPVLTRSTSIRCVSVPPDTIDIPLLIRPSLSAFALATIFCWYTLNSGCSASLKHTAFAAITCIRGPPCIPGNTALFNLSSSATAWLLMIIPPLGPLRVLWVVVVVICAYSIGLWWSPAATSPAICAISAIR